jgi:hypothetical protein
MFVSVGQPPGFDETGFRILEAVAHQASNLVDHARTFDKLRHSARVRAGLAALAAAVNLETDPVRDRTAHQQPGCGAVPSQCRRGAGARW